MKTILLTAMLSSVALGSFVCGGQTRVSKAGAEPGVRNKMCSPPAMQIEVDQPSSLKRPLEVRWKITNVGLEPVYVYSTLLKKTNFAEVDINEKDKVIEVRFLRLQQVGVSPYYFPDTEFAEIAPGQSQEGRFVGSGSAARAVSYRSGGRNVRTETIKPGAWTVRGLAAYGCEIESIQNARHVGHPIDPVVEWQKVVHSQPVHVTFNK